MEHRKVLFVSSDHVAASFLERQLGTGYEVHSAATEDAAFALLEIYAYSWVILDLSLHAFSAIHLNALTTHVAVIVPRGSETVLPPDAIVCVQDDDTFARVAAMIREHR